MREEWDGSVGTLPELDPDYVTECFKATQSRVETSRWDLANFLFAVTITVETYLSALTKIFWLRKKIQNKYELDFIFSFTTGQN